MEIHWQASISNPQSPVLEYLVRVKEKDESKWTKNCTRFQTKGNSKMCVACENSRPSSLPTRVAFREKDVCDLPPKIPY